MDVRWGGLANCVLAVVEGQYWYWAMPCEQGKAMVELVV